MKSENTMKSFRRLFLLAAAGCCLAMAGGCRRNSPEHPPGQSVPDVFALGADISWVTRMEAEGLRFYNRAGEPRECTALMKEIGMDAIRLRVWVDPEDGWNGREDVLGKARRAQELGMRLMIDFHYSDTWADPGHQQPPSAWTGYDLNGLADAVERHTRDILQTLLSHGIQVEWVQVGNETADGMLHPTGRCHDHARNYAVLTSVGYRTVKSVYPEAKVIVHVDQGENLARFTWLFDELRLHGGQFDRIGMSFYPGSDWEKAVADLLSNLPVLQQRYGCPVIVCETGMPWDDAPNARRMLTALIQGAQASGCCEGVFYWEPQAPAGYNGGYTLGAFRDGRPTEALDAFRRSCR